MLRACAPCNGECALELKYLTMSQPRNFSWFVDKKVAALAYPNSSAQISFLAEQGITKLINLRGEEVPPRYAGEAEARGIEVISIPIDDFTPPTQQQITQFLHIVTTTTTVGL